MFTFYKNFIVGETFFAHHYLIFIYGFSYLTHTETSPLALIEQTVM